MSNSVRTRTITSRCQDDDEDDEDEEPQIIRGSVDGEGAKRRPQRALAGLSKDKNLLKVHITSLVSLPLLTITHHGDEVLCVVFILTSKPFSFSERIPSYWFLSHINCSLFSNTPGPKKDHITQSWRKRNLGGSSSMASWYLSEGQFRTSIALSQVFHVNTIPICPSSTWPLKWNF